MIEAIEIALAAQFKEMLISRPIDDYMSASRVGIIVQNGDAIYANIAIKELYALSMGINPDEAYNTRKAFVIRKCAEAIARMLPLPDVTV